MFCKPRGTYYGIKSLSIIIYVDDMIIQDLTEYVSYKFEVLICGCETYLWTNK